MQKNTSSQLTKVEQKKILSKFKKETKNGRKIAEDLSIPRAKVMTFLNEQKLTNYSPTSYSAS